MTRAENNTGCAKPDCVAVPCVDPTHYPAGMSAREIAKAAGAPAPKRERDPHAFARSVFVAIVAGHGANGRTFHLDDLVALSFEAAAMFDAEASKRRGGAA